MITSNENLNIVFDLEQVSRIYAYMDLLVKEVEWNKSTKSERENLLNLMSNLEIDFLIEKCQNMQGKIYFNKFKK